MSQTRVVIYGANWCPYCNNAKKLFDNLNVKAEFINTDEDPQKKQELYKKYNWNSIPMIFVDGQFKGGFTDIQAKLKKGEIKFDDKDN